MSYLHDEIDDGPQHRSAYNAPSRELTLSTPAILGIFFGLALLCAVFFGFGYNMGQQVAPGRPLPRPLQRHPARPLRHLQACAEYCLTCNPPGPLRRHRHCRSQRRHRNTFITHSARPHYTVHATAGGFNTSRSLCHTSIRDRAYLHRADRRRLASAGRGPLAALKSKGYSVASRTEPQDKLIHNSGRTLCQQKGRGSHAATPDRRQRHNAFLK